MWQIDMCVCLCKCTLHTDPKDSFFCRLSSANMCLSVPVTNRSVNSRHDGSGIFPFFFLLFIPNQQLCGMQDGIRGTHCQFWYAQSVLSKKELCRGAQEEAVLLRLCCWLGRRSQQQQQQQHDLCKKGLGLAVSIVVPLSCLAICGV